MSVWIPPGLFGPYGPGFYTETAPYDPGPIVDDPRSERRRLILPDRRVRVRLERGEWDALEDIAAREDLFLDEICAAIARNRQRRRLEQNPIR